MRIFCAAWLPWMRGYVGGGATSAREAHDEDVKTSEQVSASNEVAVQLS